MNFCMVLQFRKVNHHTSYVFYYLLFITPRSYNERYYKKKYILNKFLQFAKWSAMGYSIFYPYRGGVDKLFQGVIESKMSRGFLMKIKKFPGGYKNKKFLGPSYNCRSFQGHWFKKKLNFQGLFDFFLDFPGGMNIFWTKISKQKSSSTPLYGY